MIINKLIFARLVKNSFPEKSLQDIEKEYELYYSTEKINEETLRESIESLIKFFLEIGMC